MDIPIFRAAKRQCKQQRHNTASSSSGGAIDHDHDAKNIQEVYRQVSGSLTRTFSDLGLSEWLVRACAEMGIRRPTDIQCHTIPLVLSGCNVVGRARTGSGKTACFALPILQHLAVDPYGVFALVLTPTRELAFQISEQFDAFGVMMNLRTLVVVGGVDMTNQLAALDKKRPHVIVATPGRLAQLVSLQSASVFQAYMRHLRFLVLDEADRLFDASFVPEIRTILSVLPSSSDSNRQTLLFSATLTDSMSKLCELLSPGSSLSPASSASSALSSPERPSDSVNKHKFVYVESSHSPYATVEQLNQQYLFMPQNVKECYLAYVIRNREPRECSCIVFTATTRGCEVVAEMLRVLEIECESLHSRKNQARRLASLAKFRSGKSNVLVATDVASRGLDIAQVRLVVNYDVPRVPEDYIHRVGRTARAGQGGLALTLVSQYDVKLFQNIEALLTKTVRGGKSGTSASAAPLTSEPFKMTEFKLREAKVLDSLKQVANAKRLAKIYLEEYDLYKQVKSASTTPGASIVLANNHTRRAKTRPGAGSQKRKSRHNS